MEEIRIRDKHPGSATLVLNTASTEAQTEKSLCGSGFALILEADTDPDSHSRKKLDQDPHLSQNSGALGGPKWSRGRSQWRLGGSVHQWSQIRITGR
jgi:hypothetical protein